MNRRHFITSLLGGAAALAFDPERLLWLPGAKRIFIPPALTLGAINAAMVDSIFQSDPLLVYFRMSR